VDRARGDLQPRLSNAVGEFPIHSVYQNCRDILRRHIVGRPRHPNDVVPGPGRNLLLAVLEARPGGDGEAAFAVVADLGEDVSSRVLCRLRVAEEVVHQHPAIRRDRVPEGARIMAEEIGHEVAQRARPLSPALASPTASSTITNTFATAFPLAFALVFALALALVVLGAVPRAALALALALATS
jgi:hypothetical protein